MAPGILRTASAAMSRNPAAASQACGFDRSPRVIRVAGSSATTPAFWSAMSARKNPMPAAMPSFRLMGMASISQARKDDSESAKNSTPETNTRASASC
jgi:hypothetical protein